MLEIDPSTIVAFHTIGIYCIVEHTTTTAGNLFSVNVAGTSTGRSGRSLDEALVIAIDFKHHGSDSPVLESVLTLLDMKEGYTTLCERCSKETDQPVSGKWGWLLCPNCAEEVDEGATRS